MDINTKLFLFQQYFIPVLLCLYLPVLLYIHILNKCKKKADKEAVESINKRIKALKIILICFSVPIAGFVLMLLFWP